MLSSSRALSRRDSFTRFAYVPNSPVKTCVGGHLPGARHLSHADLMEKGVVHAAPVLRARMKGAGFELDDHIVTHCEGGGRAALGGGASARGFRRRSCLPSQLWRLGDGRELPDRQRLIGDAGDRNADMTINAGDCFDGGDPDLTPMFQPLIPDGLNIDTSPVPVPD